jgi:hypothetical protein
MRLDASTNSATDIGDLPLRRHLFEARCQVNLLVLNFLAQNLAKNPCSVQYLKKVPHATSQTICRRHQHDVAFASAGRNQHLVERRALRFCAADLVSVLVNDFEAALLSNPS